METLYPSPTRRYSSLTLDKNSISKKKKKGKDKLRALRGRSEAKDSHKNDCDEDCYDHSSNMNGSGTRDSKGLNSISSKNHSSLSSPTPTSVVTVVVLQLGVYQTGSASLPVQTPAPILPSDNINNSTVSSPPISNVRLGASGSVLEGSDSRSDSSGGFLKSYHGLSTLGGLLGGIVGLLLVGSAVRAWFSWRERKKNADILDMMAPSSLPERFVTGERDNPRLSSIWTIKSSDRYAHNYSTS